MSHCDFAEKNAKFNAGNNFNVNRFRKLHRGREFNSYLSIEQISILSIFQATFSDIFVIYCHNQCCQLCQFETNKYEICLQIVIVYHIFFFLSFSRLHTIYTIQAIFIKLRFPENGIVGNTACISYLLTETSIQLIPKMQLPEFVTVFCKYRANLNYFDFFSRIKLFSNSKCNTLLCKMQKGSRLIIVTFFLQKQCQEP